MNKQPTIEPFPSSVREYSNQEFKIPTSSVFVLAFLKWYFGKILVNWKQWMKPNWMNVSLFGNTYNIMVDAIICVGGLEQWKSYFNFCFQYRINSGEETHSVPVNSQSGLRIVLSIRIHCPVISWIKIQIPRTIAKNQFTIP